MIIHSGFFHWKWWISIVMLVISRGYLMCFQWMCQGRPCALLCCADALRHGSGQQSHPTGVGWASCMAGPATGCSIHGGDAQVGGATATWHHWNPKHDPSLPMSLCTFDMLVSFEGNHNDTSFISCIVGIAILNHPPYYCYAHITQSQGISDPPHTTLGHWAILAKRWSLFGETAILQYATELRRHTYDIFYTLALVYIYI